MKAHGKLHFLCILTIVALLAPAGCGGGGGGGESSAPGGTGGSGGAAAQAVQTVSGVAAAGAPLVGCVWLKDSGNPATTLGPNEIALDGSFSFTVTGLIPPFYLQAIGTAGGQGFQLYSATTGSGTTNINPLTSVAVAAAGGTADPGQVYNDQAQYPITQTNLAAAVSDIRNALQSLLSAYSADTNFMNGSYAANGTGLDMVYDVTNVTLDTTTGTVTITDKATNSQLLSTQTTSVSDATVDTGNITQAATASNQTVADLSAIGTQVAALMSVINKGASATLSDLEPFFASNFGINDGMDRTGEMQIYLEWLAKSLPAGATVTGARVSLIEESQGSYIVGVTTTLSDGTVYSANPNGCASFIFTKDTDGTWRLAGNGYKSSFNRNRFGAVSYRFIMPDGTAQAVTGLALNAGDDGNQGLAKAIITGPGLPSGGVTIVKPPGGSSVIDLVPFSPQGPYAIPGVAGMRPYTDVYVLDDATIGAIPDNATYSYVFYDDIGCTPGTCTPVETRNMTLPRRPLLSTELAGAYATLGGVASHNLPSAHIGGQLPFTYTPSAASTAFTAVELWGTLQLWDNTSGSNASFDHVLPMNQTTSDITSATASWTATSARLDLDATDVFHREVRVQWIFGQ